MDVRYVRSKLTLSTQYLEVDLEVTKFGRSEFGCIFAVLLDGPL